MKQIYKFDKHTPPNLTKEILEEELEKRKLSKQIVLVALMGSVFNLFLFVIGILNLAYYPFLSLFCFAHISMNFIAGALIAVFYNHKGGEFLWK